MGTREVILKRRARFVAASLAAAGLVATPSAQAEDGGEDASVDASDAGDASEDAKPPEVCLSIRRDDDPTEPQSCLCACAVPENDLSPAPAAAALGAAAILAARRRKRPAR